MNKKEAFKIITQKINYTLIAPCSTCSVNQFHCEKVENETCPNLQEWAKFMDAMNLLSEVDCDSIKENDKNKIIHVLTILYSNTEKTKCKLFKDKEEAVKKLNDYVLRDVQNLEKEGFFVSEIVKQSLQTTIVFINNKEDIVKVHYCIHKSKM